MVRFSTIIGGLIAMLMLALGIAFGLTDWWSNVEFMAGRRLTVPDLLQASLWDSTKVAVVVVGVGTSVSVSAAMWSFARGAQAVGAGLLALFVFGAGFSLYATTSRVAVNTDTAERSNLSHNLAIDEAKTDIETNSDSLAAAQRGIMAECDGKDPATLDPGRWPLCVGHWKAAAIAKQRLDEARSRRADLGARKVVNSGAKRFAALLFWMTEDTVALYQPFFQPLALFLGGTFFPALSVLIFSNLGPIIDRRQQFAGTVDHKMKDITPHLHPIEVARRKAGRPLSNREVARAIRGDDTKAHRVVKALVAQGKLVKWKEPNGKEVCIDLVKN
jgi:hypothetical protein